MKRRKTNCNKANIFIFMNGTQQQQQTNKNIYMYRRDRYRDDDSIQREQA